MRIKINKFKGNIIKGNCKLCNKKMQYQERWDFDYTRFSYSEELHPPTQGTLQYIGFGHRITVCMKCFKKYRDKFENEGKKLFKKLLNENSLNLSYYHPKKD